MTPNEAVLTPWPLTMSLPIVDYGTDQLNSSIEFDYESDFIPASASIRRRILVRDYSANVVRPAIFAFGILGNTANLLLLTSRRLYPNRRQSTHMERSAIAGLKNLALSDLLFCLFGFPDTFLVPQKATSFAIAIRYYLGYKLAFINIFQFSSTWLIVLICVERYIVVCHPFRAAGLIRVRRTVIAHLVVFAVSVVLNIPLILQMRDAINKTSCYNGSTCFFYVKPSLLSRRREEEKERADVHLHHVVWFAFGTFIPLVFILCSNSFLVREIYRKSKTLKSGSYISRDPGSERTRALNVESAERSSTMRLSVTLMAVVVCYLVLACPSSMLDFVGYIDGGVPGGLILSESFLWALIVTNLLQAIKFSGNFILYSIINKTFRQTFARILKGETCRSHGNKSKESLPHRSSLPQSPPPLNSDPINMQQRLRLQQMEQQPTQKSQEQQLQLPEQQLQQSS